MNKKRCGLAILFVFLSLAMKSDAGMASGNLISNPGFEEGMEGYWIKESSWASVDEEVAHSGFKSCRLEKMFVCGYKITPGVDYEVSFYAKLKDVEGFFLRPYMKDENNKSIFGGFLSSNLEKAKIVKAEGTHDWKLYSAVIEADKIHPDTAVVRLPFTVEGDGTVWIDDISVVVKPREVTRKSVEKAPEFVCCTDKEFNLFVGDPIVIKIEGKGYPSGGKFNVRCGIMDFWGKEGYSTSKMVVPDSKGNFSERIKFSEYGYFKANIMLQDATTKRNIGTQELTVGSLSKPEKDYYTPDPKSMFGTWASVEGLSQELGMKWYRDPFYWKFLETEKGVFHEDRLSRFFKFESSLTPLMCFTKQFPEWARGEGSAPKDINDWVRFVEEMVRRYKDHVKVWEVMNEPYISSGLWKGDHESYMALHKATYLAIKKEQPDSVVLGPCLNLTYNSHWVDMMKFLEMGLWDYIDGVADHPYIHTSDPEEGGFREHLQKINKVMRKYGGEKPIYITEIGWATKPFGWVTEEERAQRLVRTHIFALAEGVQCFILHKLAEGGGPISRANSLYNIESKRMRPALIAYAVMTRNLYKSNFRYMLDYLGPGVYGAVFEKQGKPIIVLWSTSKRKRPINLYVGSEKVKVGNIMGEIAEVSTKNGGLDLRVDRNPVYIHNTASDEFLKFDKRMINLNSETVKVLAGEEAHISFRVKNVLKDRLQGKVVTKARSDWKMKPKTHPLNLEPGAKINLKEKWSVPVNIPAGIYPVYGKVFQGDKFISKFIAKIEVKERFDIGSVILNIEKFEPCLKLDVAYLGNKPITVKVQCQIADETYIKDIHFLPGDKKLVEMKLDKKVVQLGKEYVGLVKISANLQRTVQKEVKLCFTPAVKTVKPIKIDGLLDDWRKIEWIPFERQLTVFNPEKWKGNEDLDAKFALQWDEDNLYLCIRVNDNIFYQPSTGLRVWGNDNIQICIDPFTGKRTDLYPPGEIQAITGKSGYYEYGLTLTEKGPEVFCWSTTNPEKVKSLDFNTEIKLAVTRKGNETIYETAIPFNQLSPFSPVIGDYFRMALAVNDRDGEKTERVAIEWFSGIVSSKNPSQYGLITLVDK